MINNYFVCTLGQAQHCDRTSARNIPDLLEKQAAEQGQLPAVGFPNLEDISATLILSYEDLNKLSRNAAVNLVHRIPRLKESLGRGDSVALLANSNLGFLTTWLGLVRLGLSVIILASHLDPSAVNHLCTIEKVKVLFHDDAHADKAATLPHIDRFAVEAGHPPSGERDNVEAERQLGPCGHIPPVTFLHHSSGTSSGKPKAIPQTNAGAVTSLPRIERLSSAATFTSTPLSQAGGTADCLRAWTSSQMIWLFPTGQKPITAQTVLACLLVAEEAASQKTASPIKYFSSVPFVLEELAQSEQGLAKLQSMDVVGVGGAALPPHLGQKLVAQGVNLISRYGSAECGFLLSSNRDFGKDKDWDYLRSQIGSENLSFEPRADGLFELVVNAGWPQLARTNRPDGSYATADLFQPHPDLPEAWRYHSRADAQIALTSGKKFDPSPMEAQLLAECEASPVLDVLIFGDGEARPGALFFVHERQKLAPLLVRDQIWLKVNDVNQQSPSYTRLSKDMIKVVIVNEDEPHPVEKSTKGTILRKNAVEKYNHAIRQMYNEPTPNNSGFDPVKDKSELIARIIHIIEDTIARKLGENDDFFEHGVDSVACVKISKDLEALVRQSQYHASKRSNMINKTPEQSNSPLVLRPTQLGPGKFYECATVAHLANFLMGETEMLKNEMQVMKQLVSKYSQFGAHQGPDKGWRKRCSTGMTMVLTGATGALGTHLLDILRSRKGVERVYCLVRARDTFAAHQRVDKALRSKAKDGLSIPILDNAKIICVPCKISQSDLGLENTMLQEIKLNVDTIIHAAWAVNFTLSLQSFESHLAGTRNLLNLGFAACQNSKGKFASEDRLAGPHVRFVFCSSVASVASYNDTTVVPETVSNNVEHASSLGYSRSKWVAEAICINAHKKAQEANIPLLVEILRIGQLCGDTKNGIWNRSEAWPLMLSSYEVAGCVPNLHHEVLDWLPLDLAARAVCEASSNPCISEDSSGSPAVFHILNPNVTPTWTEMLHWLQESQDDRLTAREPAIWLQRLESGLRENLPEHPSGKLLELWRRSYLTKEAKTKVQFATDRAASMSPAMNNIQPLSRELVEKMWTWIHRSNWHSRNSGEKA